MPVVLKQLLRHRTRTALTVLGVATAMFLFCGVQALQQGVREATQATGKETTLVVYRENRFCPFSSRLPEFYSSRIARVPGVASVVPMKIVVNNCSASLDVVTFRGVPRDEFEGFVSKGVDGEGFKIVSGSVEEWKRRSDAALVGENLAQRRGVKVGDNLTAAGVTVWVAGVIRSSQAQDQNVAYVDLTFLQRAVSRGGDGIVTQFNVKVDDPARLEAVASAIDDEFRHDPEPTDTRAEKAFVARAAGDLMQLVGFTKWLGIAALAAVLALVGNSMVLSVQDRVKEQAILQTLGYRAGLIARMIVMEGVLIGVLGGVVGSVAAYVLAHVGRFSLSVEGISMNVSADPRVLAVGLLISAGVGIVAGLVPGWQVARREIAGSFRAV